MSRDTINIEANGHRAKRGRNEVEFECSEIGGSITLHKGTRLQAF